MRFEYLQGEDFRHLLTGSLHMLGRYRAEIDALNVFPVPDGDTGTNMYLTLRAGLQEAEAASAKAIGEIAAAVARGALLGARGNSGVILSQIWQGFAGALAGCQQAGVADVARAFDAGARAAYQAVSNPVEGTILTVIRATADAFAEAAGRGYDLLRSMVHVLRRSREALARTPELLPILREAGVVDAGGRGLVVVLEGIVYALKVAAARSQLELFDLAASQQKEFIGRVQDAAALLNYTYCTEFILRGQNLPLETMRRELAPYGDCLLVVGDGTVAKVHIHSNHPGLVLECCLKYGSVHQVHINNMEEQVREKSGETVPAPAPKPVGVVAVAVGEGLSQILTSLGVDLILPGGQTMNPSAEEILDAVRAVPAHTVVVLPNNKNVLLAARQAAGLAEKRVLVVPTHSIIQGMAAMLAFNPYHEPAELLAGMERAADQVVCGEVTRAVRQTRLEGRDIAAGDYLGLDGERIVSNSPDVHQVLADLVEALLREEHGLLTLYYGAEVTEEQAGQCVHFLQTRFPSLDIELHFGGQPLYQYYLSLE